MKANRIFRATIARATFSSLVVLALFPPPDCNAQRKPYSIIKSGPNERVWQSVTAQTNVDGAITYGTNAYTEIATGLNHFVGDKWVESSENIQITQEGGAATNGQHQVFFSGNINTAGGIHLVMSDNQHLRSHIMGLAYFDAASGKSVLFADLQDSIGQILPSLNEVLYTNAFTDLKADVRYTYTKAGMEQDVILREQLPTPETWGLDPQTVWLQVWTEFVEAPVPRILLVTNKNNTGQDHILDFGAMKMGPGKAFSIDNKTALTPVIKYWQVDQQSGRKFLVEEVQLSTVAARLQKLPSGAGASGGAGASAPMPSTPGSDQSMIRRVFDHPVLLARKQAQKSATPMHLAASSPTSPGFVMDYVTLSGGSTYTFKCDTTYYISGAANFGSTNTFEGGAVFKFGPYGYLSPGFPIIWNASAYRPVIFTAMDDNTVGQTISGSTGNPSGYYGIPMLFLYGSSVSATLSGLRVSYASTGLYAWGPTIKVLNAQFVNCLVGMEATSDASVLVGNSLFATVKVTADHHINFNLDMGGAFTVENSTFVGINSWNDYLLVGNDTYNGYGSDVYGSFAITNCIIANQVNPETGYDPDSGYGSGYFFTSLTGNYNGLYNSTGDSMFGTTTFTSSSNPFQSVGGAGYYLTNGCVFTSVGTPNIDISILAEVRQRTTRPPFVFSGIYYTNNTTLYPGIQRDSVGNPTLGYHYDPIDYAFGHVLLTNATLTVAPGTVIAGFDTNASGYGLTIGAGGQFISQGTPNNLNHIVNYNTVQERSTTNWNTPTNGLIVPNWATNGPASVINCRFTDFSILANDTAHLFAVAGNTAPINFQDCQFHGGSLTSTNPTINLTNCLLERVTAKLWSYDGNTPYIRNNLFWFGTNDIQFPGITNALVQNNLFDQTGINDHGSTNYIGGYNGFVTNFNRLAVTNGDLILANSPAYQTSWLGNYYLPTNSPLINAGSTTAETVGLYQYTTTTNQVKETNSTLDIGHHYVTVNGSGQPIDSDADGIPDYLEDANGNGLFDSGESDWANPDTTGSGMLDGWQVIFGLDPRTNAATNSALRSNFTYDLVGRLNLITGIRSETLTNDVEGNIIQAH